MTLFSLHHSQNLSNHKGADRELFGIYFGVLRKKEKGEEFTVEFNEFCRNEVSCEKSMRTSQYQIHLKEE